MTSNQRTAKQREQDRQEIARLTAEYEKQKGLVKTSPSKSRLADLGSDELRELRIKSEVNAARRRIKLSNEG